MIKDTQKPIEYPFHPLYWTCPACNHQSVVVAEPAPGNEFIGGCEKCGNVYPVKFMCASWRVIFAGC